MLHYYVYKNGKGNKWFPFSATHGLLYVGFEDTDEFAGVREHRSRTAGATSRGDLDHIRCLSHPDNRERRLLLTFEPTELHVWRCNGGVESFHPRHWEGIKAAFPLGRQWPLPEELAATWPNSPPPGLRFLPVTLLGTIPRARLYTSVNSLAVYQYLNQGTCRPLWRAAGPRVPLPPEIAVDGEVEGYGGSWSCEEPFAAFARVYLNDHLLRESPSMARYIPREHRLQGCAGWSGAAVATLVRATMNPILVETAAAAFVHDLGLTADVGVGNGLDVIDVRARACRADGCPDLGLAQRAASQLSPLLRGDTRDAVLDGLRATGILDIQCKAGVGERPPERVVYFGREPGAPAAATGRISSVSLPLVVDAALGAPTEWPGVSRFLRMQEAILRGHWQGEAA